MKQETVNYEIFNKNSEKKRKLNQKWVEQNNPELYDRESKSRLRFKWEPIQLGPDA